MSTNHPIIPDSSQYLYEKQFISIHSDDRDQCKYPSPSYFEIELPQDYCNVQAIKLHDWYISPTDIRVFSAYQQNNFLCFTVYFPTTTAQCSLLIEDGTYNSAQLCNELTNKLNDAVQKETSLAYTSFIVVFNQISQQFYFGNTTNQFDINPVSVNGSYNPFLNALGFVNNNIAYSSSDIADVSSTLFSLPVSDSIWLQEGYVIIPPNRARIAMESYIYMELSGMNGLDESMSGLPVTQSGNTTLTGGCTQFRQPSQNIAAKSCISANKISYSGKVKSAFAKIPLSNPVCDLAAYYPTAAPYAASGISLSATSTSMIKSFYPPLERIRKVGIFLRYHSGQAVDFGTNTGFSITLELDLMRAQNIRPVNMYIPAASSFL